MRSVNIHEAKTHFSRLVEAAVSGETIVIAKAGRPVAHLTPLPEVPERQKSLIGFMRGRMTVPDDFDTMGQEEIIAMFEGEE